jgi:hypothetical protein
MTPIIKRQIAFDFDDDLRGAIVALESIMFSPRPTQRPPILRYENHRDYVELVNFMKSGIIVIEQCEFIVDVSQAKQANIEKIKSLLGKNGEDSVLRDMAVLLSEEQLEKIDYPPNTIYLSNRKTIVSADEIKPESILYLNASEQCESIIQFPHYKSTDRSVYYEFSISIEKAKFIDLQRCIDKLEEKMNSELDAAINFAKSVE